MLRLLAALIALLLPVQALADPCELVDLWLGRGISAEYIREALTRRGDIDGLACLDSASRAAGDEPDAAPDSTGLVRPAQRDCSMVEGWHEDGVPEDLAERRAGFSRDPLHVQQCVSLVYTPRKAAQVSLASPALDRLQERRQLGTGLIGAGVGGLALSGVLTGAIAMGNFVSVLDSTAGCIGSLGMSCEPAQTTRMAVPAVLATVSGAMTVAGIGVSVSADHARRGRAAEVGVRARF